MGGYAASKFALRALNDSLRRELRPFGIQVILIELGFTSTPMGERGISEAKKSLEDFSPEAKDLYSRVLLAAIRVMTEAFEDAAPAEKAAEMIFRAFQAKRPKFRYQAGAHIRKANIPNFLPARWVDRQIRRVLSRNL